jgi:hypothetical protein
VQYYLTYIRKYDISTLKEKQYEKIFFLIIYILFVQNVYSQNNQPHKLDIKVYFNDIEISGSVYNNGSKLNIYENYLNSYISLVNIFHLLESEVLINGNLIEIKNKKLGNFVIIYESPDNIIFNPRPSPFPSTNNSIIIIDDEFYIRINLVRYLISGYTEENEGKVKLYSRDYERHVLPILNIKAYLNNNEIEGPVYKNIYSPPVQGTDFLGSFIKLNNIFHLMEAEVKFNNRIIEINGKNTGNIKINYVNQNNITINSSFIRNLMSGNFTKNSIVKIDNKYYISISMVRYLINGVLEEDEKSVTLYTSDYERLDIPLTLNDCYIALDKLLNDQTKKDIKLSSVNDLIKYHMGLGMWIRNNWIRQTNNRITKLFLDNGAKHPDDVSQAIIIGYHYYLNGIVKNIEELLNE